MTHATMLSMRIVRYAVVSFLLCITGTPQEGTGRISGQVKDTVGTPIAKAIVTLRANGSLTNVGQSTTDETGKFVLVGPLPQVYDLFLQAPGFQAVAVTRRVGIRSDIRIPTIVMKAADIGGLQVTQDPPSTRRR